MSNNSEVLKDLEMFLEVLEFQSRDTTGAKTKEQIVIIHFLVLNRAL